MKVIEGQRSTLEQALTRALFRGETERFEQINDQLKPRAVTLSTIATSDRDVPAAPRRSDEAQD